MTLQTTTKTDGATGLFTVTAARLPELIDEIGMGMFQIIQFLPVLFVPLCEGANILVMTNVTHALKQNFQLSSWQAGSLDAFSFLGLALGHYVAGFLADLRGRRLPMVLSFLGMTLGSVLMTLATGYEAMVMLRLLHGLCCGLGVPPAASMIAETVPSAWRRFVFVLFWSSTALGETYACCGLMLYMPNLTETAWKQAVLWTSLPAFFMLILSVATLQDSPHWLAVHGRLIEARIVLDRMARMNKKEEVLKKLGPAPAHDFSNLYGVITARAGHGPSPQALYQRLVQPETLKLVCLFSVLASVGNIETFGMSNVWPEMLREEAADEHLHGHVSKVTPPAQKLALIVSIGIPVGMASALLSFSETASHRVYIVLAGLVGCAGILCASFLQHLQRAAILMAAILVTHMSGTLQYAVAMIFCEESFPTDIRASATGIVIFWGTLWSVFSPLLLTAVGEPGFLALAAAAFLVSAVCVLPLQETHRAELKDFVEEDGENFEEGEAEAAEAAEEESELSEGETDTVGGATTVSSQEPTSVAFADGTLGAALELKLVFFLLGAVPGVSFTAFYSSMGFLIDRCRDRSFFAQACPESLRVRDVGGKRSRGAGFAALDTALSFHLHSLGLGTFSLFLVDLLMAFPEHENVMLALGFLQGLLNVTVLSTILSLASELCDNCRSWVQLGFATGALLPVLAVPCTGFGPKSPLSVRLTYYLLPALFCLLAAMIYGGVYHRKVTEVNRMGRRVKGNLADLVMAYAKTNFPSSAAAPALAFGGLDGMALLLILGYQFAAYFFAGVFPFYGDAAAALMLYLYMIAGDMMGNLAAFAWAAVMDLPSLGRALKERGRGSTGSLASAAAATCYGALLLLLLIAGLTAGLGSWGAAVQAAKDETDTKAKAPVPTQLCFVTFFFGAFAKGGLDELRLVGGTSNLVRFARLFGSLLGLLAALLCCLSRDFSQEISPKDRDRTEAQSFLDLDVLSLSQSRSFRFLMPLQVQVTHAGSFGLQREF
ncbi:SLC22A1 [Symbiodinium sp. KB8]|nr:SLC22A1 [Symbiodinium sp. KB8]